MSQDPHVQTAVMFGRGRLQNGILVEPKQQFSFDTRDSAALEAFKELIWWASSMTIRHHESNPKLGPLSNE